MALPLAHRLTHKPVYIPSEDDAWDVERIDREMGWINETIPVPEGEVCPWQDWEDHPVSRFRSGQSRYDLATVQEYLDMTKNPLRFNLNRLSLRQWDDCQALAEQGGGGVVYASAKSRFFAIKHAVQSIEGLADWNFKPGKDGLTDTAIESLRDLIGEHQYIMLGFAAIAASRPLDPLEKKA